MEKIWPKSCQEQPSSKVLLAYIVFCLENCRLINFPWLDPKVCFNLMESTKLIHCWTMTWIIFSGEHVCISFPLSSSILFREIRRSDTYIAFVSAFWALHGLIQYMWREENLVILINQKWGRKLMRHCSIHAVLLSYTPFWQTLFSFSYFYFYLIPILYFA